MDLISETVPSQPGRSLYAHRRRNQRWAFAWHHHPEFELVLIIQGQGVRVVGDGFTPYRAGDLVLLGPNLPHTWASQGPGPQEALVIQVHPERLRPLLAAVPEAEPVDRLLTGADRGWSFPSWSDQESVTAVVAAEGLVRVLAWWHLLHRLSLVERQPILTQPWRRSGNDDGRLDRILSWLSVHAHRHVSLAEAAAAMEMSPGGLGRFLRRASGRSFTDHLQSLRLSRAAARLASSNERVLDIALAVGFGSLAQFNRCFRQRFGCAPRAYREQVQRG